MKTLNLLIAFLAIAILVNSCDECECEPELTNDVLSLKPGGEEGKDALFGKIVPDNNYGDAEFIHLYAWTQNGILNVNRVAIDFDLSDLPVNATIDSAFISLFFDYTSPYGEKHEGENSFIIQRITTEWQESTVTWSTQPSATEINQVFVEGASLPTQNFPDINITPLVKDYWEAMDNSFGFLLKLRQEEPYRWLLLASSDHQDEQIRPKLDIYYSYLGVNQE